MSGPGADAPRGGLTYADYAALPDDGKRYQLVEGELVVTPSPTRWHQQVILGLARALARHVEERDAGELNVAPLDVILDDHTVVQPDLVFVARAGAAVLRDANIEGPPDLCVEVLSPGTARLDRVRKLDLYARHGVPHSWIVDLTARTIEEYALDGDAYRVRSVAGNDDDFQPALFPGFAFRLATLGLPPPRTP